MKLLLTSSGITNPTIHDALVDLLGKPVAESNALFVPTGIYPFSGGAAMAYRAVCGQAPTPLCELGWKSLGLLELTALPSIDRNVWAPSVEKTDALLVWGGDPLYLSYWMNLSGLTDLLKSMQCPIVYVGVSAGSILAAPTFGETYQKPYRGTGTPLTLEDMMISTPEGEIAKNFITAKGAGFTNFALIPHANHSDHPSASFANAQKWAARLPVPVFAIDDQTAIKVNGDSVEIISEGEWKRFTA
jgi:dipeptidase E